jgi:hypothetical protein
VILNGWICRQPCRVCGGPVIEIMADGSTIMRHCLMLLSPGRDWFAFDRFEGEKQPGDERLMNIPPEHEILTLIHERHAEAARAMEAAEKREGG